MIRPNYARGGHRHYPRMLYRFLYSVSILACVGAPAALLFLGVLDYRGGVGSGMIASLTTERQRDPFAPRKAAMSRQVSGTIPHANWHYQHLLQRERQQWVDALVRGEWTELDRKCHRSWSERAPAGQKADSLRAVAHLLPVRYSREEPAFLWAVVPNRRMISWLQNHEGHVRSFARRVLQQSCAPDQGPLPPIVVDVGANSGYYGLMGLAYGCWSLFVEPQPYCSMLIETSLVANGWHQNGDAGPADIWRVAAGNSTRRDGLQVWCDTPCYGTVGAPGVSRPTADMQGDPHPRDVGGWRPMVPLTVHPWFSGTRDIALLKIDVEGGEASVLRGLRPIFGQRAVRAATIEISPQFYVRRKQNTELRQAIHEEIAFIWNHGYGIWAPIGNERTRRDGRGNKYRRLYSAAQIREYLLQHAFTQHDLFVHRLSEETDDQTLAWISNELQVPPM